MSANTFGERFRVTSFGESHGAALGVVIDGCPAGMAFDAGMLQADLNKRRPGATLGTSQRKESDQAEILSGVFEDKTLGTPICIVVRNQDARSNDYSEIKNSPRVGHADDVWKNKFTHADYRGGGRSSGRETVARVMAGSVAKMLIKSLAPETQIIVRATQVGPYQIKEGQIGSEITQALLEAQTQGQSWGGQVSIEILNSAAGLGQPVFHKLKSDFALAMMSIGATSAFEIGDGVNAKDQLGTDFHGQDESPYGGIRGGISTGEKIEMKVTFKPTSSILDVAKKGRHDPCIVLRAIPVVEAMAAVVLADHLLWQRTDRI